MESLDYWRLCEELTIVQAALLLIDHDPGGESGYVETWEKHQQPLGYEAAKTAITNALRRGTIKGQRLSYVERDSDGNRVGAMEEDPVDIESSRVEVESLREWLASKGIRPSFFFPTATDAPDYLDPKNPRYAPKLAAAVRAWQAVGYPEGRTPKQGLDKWLREHAPEFGLTDDEDGKVNESGIEQVSKVANWQPAGGAPKTPGN